MEQTQETQVEQMENHFMSYHGLKYYLREGKVFSFADFINIRAEEALKTYREYRDNARVNLKKANQELERLTAMSQEDIEAMFLEAAAALNQNDLEARAWLQNELQTQKYMLAQIEASMNLNIEDMERLHRYFAGEVSLTEGALRLRERGVCQLKEKTAQELYNKLLNKAQEEAKSALDNYGKHQKKIQAIQAQREYMLKNIPTSATIEHTFPINKKEEKS